MILDGTIFDEGKVTLRRLAIAMVLSIVGGGVVGLLVAVSRPLDWLTKPLVAVFFPIPKIAFLPVLLFIAGRTELTYVIITFLTAFFQVMIGTRAAVKQMDAQLIEAAKVFGISRSGMLFRVLLPACLPGMLVVTRIAIGLCVIAVAAVEFISARSGLGYVVYMAWQTLDVDRMYAGVIVIGTLGLACSALVGWIQKRFGSPEFRSPTIARVPARTVETAAV